MLLRNYDNIMVVNTAIGKATGDNIQTGTDFTDGILNVKPLTGIVGAITQNDTGDRAIPFAQMQSSLSNTAGYSWFVVGSGTTPATYDDYKLENPFTTQISWDANSWLLSNFLYDQENNIFLRTGSYSFQAKQDITIGEIGIIYNMGTNDNLRYLVYHKVLETPISVAAGQYCRASLTTTTYANSNKPVDYQASISIE